MYNDQGYLISYMRDQGEEGMGIHFKLPDIYIENDVTKTSLAILDEIGLIRINNLAGGIRNSGIKDIIYHGKLIPIRRFDENESLAIGKVEFTGIGQELATICDVPAVDEFYKYIIETMWKNFVDYSRLPAY